MLRTMVVMNELWELACRDAGFVPGQDVVLQALPGRPPGGEQQAWAVWLMPDVQAHSNPSFPLTGAQIAALNAPDARDKVRVLAFTDAQPEVLLGYLRHELEHARQLKINPADAAFSPIVMLAITKQFGDLDGTGSIYNLLPREVDANAAAAALIRAHFGPQPSAHYRGLHAALFRPTDPPEDPTTLFFRTFCLGYLLKDGLRAAFDEFGLHTQEEFFTAQSPAFPEAWKQLEADAKLQRLVERAYKKVPSKGAIRTAGDRPGDAWVSAVRAFKTAHVRAMAVLGYPVHPESGS